MSPFDFDIQWFLALNFDGGVVLDWLMYGVSWKYTWIPLYVGVLWWVWAKKGWQTALLMLIVAIAMIASADMTASFFKHNLPKFRPTHYEPIAHMVHTVNDYRGGLYGTVSSHAANSIAFALLSLMIIRRRTYTAWMIAWVTVQCYSRIYLGVHYPMDIALGLIDGTLWFAVWWTVYKALKTKFKL